MRKLLTFLIALGAIVFAVVSPVRANRVLILVSPPSGYISALHNGAVAQSFSGDTIGAVYIGGGSTPLTNVQAAAIENRINTYLTVFGKNAY